MALWRKRNGRIWDGSPLGFTKNGIPIAWPGNEPTTILGPPGSFKTVGVIAAQLLDDDSGLRSYWVHDPKGEVCAITSSFRRSLLDHAVYIVNPYGVLTDSRRDMKSDGCNLLSGLDPASITFADDCQALGDALVKTSGNESQPHFPDSARSGITAAIMYEVIDARARNVPPSLANVRRHAVLTQDPVALRASVKKMVDCGNYDIATRARKFLADNTEIQNIKSTIETNTAWMTPALRDDMATGTGLDLKSFATRPTTVYWIVPTPELMPKAAYIRLALSAVLRALYRDDGVPATLIVDEGFVLGHHAEIEAAASILRGFSSRFTIVFQSLMQAKKLYPQTWGLFTGGALLSFRPSDLDTARELSSRAGEIIVPVRSSSDPRPGEARSGGGWQQQKRARIPVGKLFGMPRGRALVWLPGDEAPRVSWVKGYFEIPRLAARASPNPYYRDASPLPGRHIARRVTCVAAAMLIAALLLVPSSVMPVGAQPHVQIPPARPPVVHRNAPRR